MKWVASVFLMIVVVIVAVLFQEDREIRSNIAATPVRKAVGPKPDIEMPKKPKVDITEHRVQWSSEIKNGRRLSEIVGPLSCRPAFVEQGIDVLYSVDKANWKVREKSTAPDMRYFRYWEDRPTSEPMIYWLYCS